MVQILLSQKRAPEGLRGTGLEGVLITGVLDGVALLDNRISRWCGIA